MSARPPSDTAEMAGLPTGGSEGPAGGPDIATKAAGKVETLVSLVRDKTVVPVGKAVRFLVFGLLAASVLGLLAVLFAIFGLRVLDNEVHPFTHRVWASYLVLAGIFWLTGAFLSRRRHPRS